MIQLSLITAILMEMERQQPGIKISQRQFAAVVQAVDTIVAAMRPSSADVKDAE